MPETNERVTTPEYNYPNFTYEMSSNVSNQSALNNVEYNYPDFSMLNDSEPTTNDDAKAFQSQESGPVDAETHVYSTSGNENEYNTTSKRPDVLPNETYDHADPMTKGGSNTLGDTTYDVSMSTDAQLQKFGEHTDNVYNTGNDTYNQLGGDNPEFKKSDNVYGSNQIETYKRVPNIGDDKDGPYNSTSEKFENCGITDNPYSELEAH
ncbi:uncharacterized protein LOC132723597 [Ruditapes philippinarum]|uniref:uncharacterized protein LOC132723597 n=1 Tax=Ruditapes philippinarum TaxID=129788 RepID=UPI00295AD03F|nr:uncharacterized protein LOC132723597 [Ruditapes philippinarum]